MDIEKFKDKLYESCYYTKYEIEKPSCNNEEGEFIEELDELLPPSEEYELDYDEIVEIQALPLETKKKIVHDMNEEFQLLNTEDDFMELFIDEKSENIKYRNITSNFYLLD